MSLKVKLSYEQFSKQIYNKIPIQVILWRKNPNSFSCLLYANYHRNILQIF